MGVTDGPGVDPDQVTESPVRPLPAHRRPVLLAVIFVGGALGTLTRALLESRFPAQPYGWPWTTLAINVSGSLLLGLLLEVLTRTGADTGWRRTARLGLGTGVLGGFTTYSTFAVEVVERLTPKALAVGFAYAMTSVVLGVSAAAGGFQLARRVRRRPPVGDGS